MGLPLGLDAVVQTVLFLNQMVQLAQKDPSLVLGSEALRSIPTSLDRTHGMPECRVTAAKDSLRDLANANCEALWARFSEAADEAYAIANRRDWHVDSNDDGVVVKRVYLPTYKRSVILGETILNISPEDGLYLYWDDGKDIPNWNPEISYLEDVVEIAPELRVSYQVGSSKLGGLIKPRDFLVLTGWLERNRNYYVVYTNITNEYRPKPIESHYVRGQNGPSLIAFERVPTDPNKTLFRYLLNVDMNHGSWFIIPRSVYEKATSAAIRDYLQYVRDRTNRVPLFSPPRKSIRPHHTNLF